MRHRTGNPKFGRPTDQRLAGVYQQAGALIEHGKIKILLVRAKQVRRIAEHLITLAKKNDLNSRRQALKVLKDRDKVKTLFGLGPRFEGRAGGFTRIIKTGFRRGDAAAMAVLELV
ncbi:50S ribosomal protein L17 [Candidatus Saganbacteria bacterium]|nr:50S ribosomal protein L17 [Candidatus Saganbacteria bacterium]